MTLAVYGDAPYGTTPTDTAEFAATPAFIDSVNADPDVSLVLHVGDIHSGKQYCTEAYDQSISDLWTSVRGPAGLHARRQRVDRLPQDGRGRRRLQRDDRADRLRARRRRQPGRLRRAATRSPTSPWCARSSSRTPGVTLGQHKLQVLSQAQRLRTARTRPTRRTSRTSCGSSAASCSSPSTCPAAPTTTPTPGTARRPTTAAQTAGDRRTAPAPTCAGSTRAFAPAQRGRRQGAS